MIKLEDFFNKYESSFCIFQVICEFADSMGAIDYQVSKSQIALRRKKAFAWIWIPEMYLHGKTAPLVLTFSFRYRHPSPRWKQIVEPYPGRFTHHLELFTPQDFDDEVRGWLKDAWEAVG